MEMHVYNSEYHERGQLRYIIFALFFTTLIVFLILYENYIGAIMLLFLLGGYFFFSLMMGDEISLVIHETHLLIGEKVIPWTRLQWYSLEVDARSQSLKNIVIVSDKQFFIHTISETDTEKTKEFITTLSTHIPLVSQIPQSFAEKVRRFLKL